MTALHDDDGDYSRRRRMMHLEESNAEAERWTFNQRIAEAKQAKKKLISKADSKTSKIADLRQKTSQINYEMETDKVLAWTMRYQEASLARYLAKLTPEQQREREEDMTRIAQYYSDATLMSRQIGVKLPQQRLEIRDSAKQLQLPAPVYI